MGWCIDPEPLRRELLAYDGWDRHNARTRYPVHAQVSDIWVRYNAWENYKGDLHGMSYEHESVWYPAYSELTSLPGVIEACRLHAGAETLGGIFITRLPPGKRVLPHADDGWHARTYSYKFALQIAGNACQAFCFEGHQLSAAPGELYAFDNLQTHWVYNMSDEDRITLIITALPPKEA